MHLITSKQITNSNFWLYALQAIVAMTVGIMIVAWPQPTLAIFIYTFGVFAVVDGLVAIAIAFSRRKEGTYWWVTLLKGLIGIVVGILIFVYPHATGLLLAYLVAAWALLMGLFFIVNTFLPGYSLVQRLMHALTGILSIVLAVFLFARPGKGVLSLTWLIGVFCIVYGALLLIHVMFPGKAASISSEEPAKSYRKG